MGALVTNPVPDNVVDIRVRNEAKPDLDVARIKRIVGWAEGAADTTIQGDWDQGCWGGYSFEDRVLLDQQWERGDEYGTIPIDDLTSDEIDQIMRAGRAGCGTTACLAGAAVQTEGYRLDFSQSEAYFDEGKVHVETAWCVNEAGQRELVRELATNLLGLTAPEAAQLFDMLNDLPKVKRLVNTFAAERGMEPVFRGGRPRVR